MRDKGSITLNVDKLEMDRTYEIGENYLEIDCGVRKIKINFKKK